MSKHLDTHVFCLNPDANIASEGMFFVTEIYFGDLYPYPMRLRQSVELNSYGNVAKIELAPNATLTPNVLRKIADELEAKIKTAKELSEMIPF